MRLCCPCVKGVIKAILGESVSSVSIVCMKGRTSGSACV